MYYDHAAWVTENNFTRIHAKWETSEEWRTVTVDDGSPQVDEDHTDKLWIGNPDALFDDNESLRIRLHNNNLHGSANACQTFRAIPTTGTALHLLYVRLKATVPYADGGYYGHFRLEYTREDGVVITALSNTKSYDGYVRIVDNVLEVRLVAETEQYDHELDYLWLDFYVMRPYFVSPSRVYGKLPDGREVPFCRPRTFDNNNYGFVNVQTSVEEQSLMTVPAGHPFGSAFSVCTTRGDMRLVIYE